MLIFSFDICSGVLGDLPRAAQGELDALPLGGLIAHIVSPHYITMMINNIIIVS